ncbi:hypothetical protein DFH09DRAFT_1068790 [Mycena vulgaris]|nr:hypothetical protein DFH09DRAFT_1068790 [Mycena vulgaris]
MLKSIAFLSLLLAGVHGKSLVEERRDGPAPGFSLTEPTPPGQILNLRILIANYFITALLDQAHHLVTMKNPPQTVFNGVVLALELGFAPNSNIRAGTSPY